jgi:hypothetical protein
MRRERGEISTHGEGELQKIKVNQVKNKARVLAPRGRIVGGGGFASAAAPGRRYENTAGRGLWWAQVPRAFLDPNTAGSGKSVSKTPWSCGWDSCGSNSLCQDRDRRWPFEILVL